MSNSRPSLLRRALIEEHNALRELLAEVEMIARVFEIDAGAPRRFAHALEALTSALQEHNAKEEDALEPLLEASDAWGPVRIEQMRHEHAAEHGDLRRALHASDGAALAHAIPDLAARLREHMASEERTFLHPDLLRDDVVSLGITS